MQDYLTVLRILIRDMLGNFRRRAFLIQAYQLASNLLGMGAGLAIFTVLLSLETGRLRIGGYSYEFVPNNTDLIFVFGIIGVLLLARSFLQFKSDISINKLCRLYEEYNVVRAFKKVDNLDLAAFAKLHPGFDRRSAFRSVQTDARFSATAQRMLLRSFVPSLMALVGMVILVVINPISILLLILFLALAAVPIWHLSRSAFRISESFESHAQKASKAKSDALDEVLQRVPLSVDDEIDHHELPAQADVKSFMDVFEQRFNLISQSGMATGMLSALVVSIVSAVFAWQAMKGQMPWSFVILNFVALQFIFQAIQRVSGLFVSMNRFYTQLKRYFNLVGYGGNIDSDDNGEIAKLSADKNWSFPLNLQSSGEEKFNIELNKGGRMFLVSGAKMDRLSVFQFLVAMDLHKIKGAEGKQDPTLCVFRQVDSKRTLKHPQKIKNILEAIAPKGTKTDGKKPVVSTVVPPLNDEDTVKRDIFLDDCISLAKTNNKILFLDQLGLLKLTPNQVAALLREFADCFVFVFAFRSLQPAKTWGIEKIISFDGLKVTAILSSEENAADRDLLRSLTKLAQVESLDVASIDIAGIE